VDAGKTWRTVDRSLIHDGDCHWWNFGICTCGLIHHLMPRDDATQIMPDYWEQRAIHETRIEQLEYIDGKRRRVG